MKIPLCLLGFVATAFINVVDLAAIPMELEKSAEKERTPVSQRMEREESRTGDSSEMEGNLFMKDVLEEMPSQEGVVRNAASTVEAELPEEIQEWVNDTQEEIKSAKGFKENAKEHFNEVKERLTSSQTSFYANFIGTAERLVNSVDTFLQEFLNETIKKSKEGSPQDLDILLAKIKGIHFYAQKIKSQLERGVRDTIKSNNVLVELSEEERESKGCCFGIFK